MKSPMPVQNYPLEVCHPGLARGTLPGRFRAVAEQLGAAGIELQPPGEARNGKTPVIFLIDDTTTDEQEAVCLHELQEEQRHVVVLSTGEKKLPFYRVWRLLGQGVDDVLQFSPELRLAELLRARFQRWARLDAVLASDRVRKILLGSTQRWQKTLRQIVEIALFSNAPVLVLGESGTGKELVARLIHDLDPRPDKQGLVLLDCTTIVPELSGSEFFGHEKGAFTNALANRDGAVALADRGTLFLDEIGELPLPLQAELLRVSQEGAYKRVGSNIWKRAQFRLICATNRDLEQEVAKGQFRQDLYYRLGTCVVHLPPLRERRLDIPELAEYFLAQTLQTDRPPPFDPLVLNFLMSHPYPGNIRQLRQLVSRIAYRHTGAGAVTIGAIPECDRDSFAFAEHDWQQNGFRDAIRHALSDGVGLKDIKRIAGDVAMDIAIEEATGNLQEAARRLDVSDRLVQGYLAEKKNGA
jgi:transcriptional regulator with GAF, ATPase, and Fis domain